MFFWNSRFFDDPSDVGNLIFASYAFSKSNVNIWKFMVHVLLKPGLEYFEHYFAGIWDEWACEYTEELYRKDLHDPDNYNGVTHLEPDVLEWEVK